MWEIKEGNRGDRDYSGCDLDGEFSKRVTVADRQVGVTVGEYDIGN